MWGCVVIFFGKCTYIMIIIPSPTSKCTKNFAIELMNLVLNLLNGQDLVKFFQEFKLHKNCVINPAHQNVFGAS